MSELDQANAALALGDILLNNLRKDYDAKVVEIGNLNTEIIEIKEDKRILIQTLENFIAKDEREMILLKASIQRLQERTSIAKDIILRIKNSNAMG